VFLIDDLDRCDADYVVEFLEVVQTLVRDAPQFLPDSDGRLKVAQRIRRVMLRLPGYGNLAGPYVFIAADGQWIRSSYEQHYDTFRQTALQGRPLGYLFLEKVFQLHVRLTSITPGAREAFLDTLLTPARRHRLPSGQHDVISTAKAAVRDARSEAEVIAVAQKAAVDVVDPMAKMEILGDAAVKFSERAIEQATEHELHPFGTFLEPNPRSIKLFVNTYGVLRSLRTLEEVFIPTGPLALWAVLEIRWPYLADYLRTHPDTIEHYRTGQDVPDEVKLLLMNKQVEPILTDPRWGGPLTSDLIRQCAGAA
jgi:hypothetical protein